VQPVAAVSESSSIAEAAAARWAAVQPVAASMTIAEFFDGITEFSKLSEF
jgi:hypothetical protein